jgi:hypothetical protein
MADNLTTQSATPATIPASTVISTDEVGVNGGTTAHVQFVKIVDGRSNGTDGLPGDAQGAWVVPRRDLVRIADSSAASELTIATTAYTAGDQVGVMFQFANAARASGGTGTLVGVQLTDAGDVIGGYDVVVCRSNITLAANNAAFAISDTDALNVIGVVQLVGAIDLGNNRIAQQFNQPMPYVCSGGTTLYAALITRSGHAVFTAHTDLQLTAWVERN